MATKGAEYSRRYRERHPDRWRASQAKYKAKQPTMHKRLAALEAAAARVTALRAQAWCDPDDLDDAMRQLAALLPEQP